MIIQDIKVPIGYDENYLYQKILKKSPGLKKNGGIQSVRILKRSIDARKKPDLFYCMTVAVNEGKKEDRETLLKKRKVQKLRTKETPVLVCGAGPSGLFAAIELLENGIPVCLIEQGKPVSERLKDVETFWNTGELSEHSNVQFGEGGAGTFSDGKLTARTKNQKDEVKQVLETFFMFGGEEEILYDHLPHIGTDALMQIITGMRNYIETLGGKVCFSTFLKDILVEQDQITGALLETLEGEICFNTDRILLCIGHSSRKTYEMLLSHQVILEKKSFAVGVRVQHPERMITENQYGTLDYEELGAAPYSVTAKTSMQRGVYSFCMCPGGYVVNASSEKDHLAINGMSYADRSAAASNSAIVVQVSPEDYPGDVLEGLAFQRELERKSFELCAGKIPTQRYGDFKKRQKSTEVSEENPPMVKGAWEFGDLNQVFPKVLSEAIIEGMEQFGKKIPGFNREDALLYSVESRTSSPVRILRNEKFESNIQGLYPVGEGAGYSGGIVSSAVDGIKAARKIVEELENE